jgi:hypothetical protein
MQPDDGQGPDWIDMLVPTMIIGGILGAILYVALMLAAMP